MAWFRNHYHCGDCGTDWEDEWSCCCDDDCPSCGSRHWSPVESDDLTEVIDITGNSVVLLRSPEGAEHHPDYEAVAHFASEEAAQRYVDSGELI